MTTAPLDVEKCLRMMDLYNAKDTPAVQAFGVPVIDTLTQLCAALTLLAEAREALTKLLAGRRFGESGHVYRLEVNVEDDARAEDLLARIPDLSKLKP